MAKAKKARITKAVVSKLEPDETVRDTEIRGFGVRRQKGAPFYFLQKRINGKLRWFTIGQHGSPWTAEQARKEAMRLLQDITAGIDPRVELVSEKAKPTLADAAPQFMEEHGPKLKPITRREYQRLLKLNILPKLGSIRLENITRSDISRFHARLSKTPYVGNYALAVLSKLMNWAEQMGLRPDHSNPCRGIKKYRANKRERYLTTTELETLGGVLAKAEAEGSETEYVLAALKLLILTGARLNEILKLKWSYVNYDRRVLDLPDSKTGKKLIKLNKAAIEVLNAIPQLKNNPHVIVGHREGAHLVNLQKPWTRIREEAGLEDVRIHDLRHSFASFAVSSGASLPMIGKLLGHSQPQTTARYAHLADDPVQALNEEVGDIMAGALFGSVEADK